jgi:SagB-type dehydrogenase family enzyme
MKHLILALVISLAPVCVNAANAEIKLPPPQKTGGMPLMEALDKRQSNRTFSAKELSNQTLSNLLWAAFGVNRAGSGKRTAPSARNWQEIDIYVCNKDGVYIYDAKNNSLKPLMEKDIRADTGKQKFTKDAPVCLVYVSNFDRMGKSKEKLFYSGTDTGFISQNVYLFCASSGLNTVVLGYVDKAALEKILKLGASQKVILTQPVGYPK